MSKLHSSQLISQRSGPRMSRLLILTSSIPQRYTLPLRTDYKIRTSTSFHLVLCSSIDHLTSYRATDPSLNTCSQSEFRILVLNTELVTEKINRSLQKYLSLAFQRAFCQPVCFAEFRPCREIMLSPDDHMENRRTSRYQCSC